MRLLGRAELAYGNARLHARRGDLLRDADYERLLGTDLRGLLDALEDTPYTAPGATRRRDELRCLHETVTRHLSRSLEQMRSFYADRARELVDLLLARFDLHNVVAVLRAHAGTPGEAETALVPVGWLAGPLAAELLAQNELAGAIDLLARSAPAPAQGIALRAALAEYERIEDLPALERAVVADHTARVYATLSAAGPDADRLLRLVRREIDEHNLVVALRLRDAVSAGADADTPPEATRLPGGSVAPAVFAYALEAPTAAAVAGRLGRLVGGTWQRPLER
jgi:vacuolar-type H+-ATPase subunit C/Vma6